MTDPATQKPIRVGAIKAPQPYIMVSMIQLESLRRILDGAQIKYEVDEDSISINGAPAMTFINLGRGTDHRAVQELLDCN